MLLVNKDYTEPKIAAPVAFWAMVSTLWAWTERAPISPKARETRLVLDDLNKIKGRWTLLIHIPVFLSSDGALETDALWAKDLMLHLDYIDDLHVCCPVIEGPAPEGHVVLDMPASQFHHLPQNAGWGSVLRNIVPHFRAIGRAAKDSDIISSGAAGWPFPVAFYLLFWRRFYRFKWVMILESSFWRLEAGEKGGLIKRLLHHLHMWLVPKCMRHATVRIFTQDEYRETLFGGHENCLVNPAVWYDEDQIETEAGLLARHDERRNQGPVPPRAIFPARLVPEKGIDTVLEALRSLACRRPDQKNVMAFDIVGQGPLAQQCQSFVAEYDGPVTVRFLDPVSYGPAFFAMLGDYDALIVTNRKSEQPRIIYDAFSQGLSAITSKTPGTSAVVEDGETGVMFDIDDAEGLAEALEALIDNPEQFRAYGQNALKRVGSMTHASMHETRRAFLAKHL